MSQQPVSSLEALIQAAKYLEENGRKKSMMFMHVCVCVVVHIFVALTSTFTFKWYVH